MNAPTPAEIPATEYKLFVREGGARFYFRNKDEGVYLSPKGIGWFVDGAARTHDWSEISSVNLQIAHVPKHGPIGSCVISFLDGRTVTVLSASEWGGSDAERNVEYGRFITDFHKAIPQSARGSILFQSGFGKARHIGLAIAFVIAAAFFIVLPLGLALYFRSLDALLIVGAGLGFLYPIYRIAKSSKPAEYHPSSVPNDFYP